MAENTETHMSETQQTLFANFISMLSQGGQQENLQTSQYVEEFNYNHDSSSTPSSTDCLTQLQTVEFEVEIFLEEVRKYPCFRSL